MMSKEQSNTTGRLAQKSPIGLSWFAVGTLVGSVITYFLDPDRGKYRRTKVLDKSRKLKNDGTEFGRKMWKHLQNETHGLTAKASRLFAEEKEVSDDILVERIRSQFGRLVSHSRPIKVTAHAGEITLTGPILAKELKKVIDCVKSVPGVKKVIDRLEIHQTSKNIPELQGKGPEYLHN